MPEKNAWQVERNYYLWSKLADGNKAGTIGFFLNRVFGFFRKNPMFSKAPKIGFLVFHTVR
jgi:hypothetical protein